MSVAAIIAEYNPLHTGHYYQIQTIKEKLNAEYIIVIMSGNYVQRGTPAIVNKYTRAKAALECGADLVIELPVFYSTASAEYFATGAVNLISQLSCVDYLCFGCESDNISLITKLANILATEPALYINTLKDSLKKGLTFMQAREVALLSCIDESEIEDAKTILNSPNSILALEYEKAIISNKYDIKPYIIKRDNNYNSTSIDGEFTSATAIRNAISKSDDTFKKYIPEMCTDLLNNISKYPIFANDFYSILANRVIFDFENANKYFDISEYLANSIKNNIMTAYTFEDLVSAIHGKHTTLTHCNRALLHIMLNITNDDMNYYISNNYNTYIRILGFRKNSSNVLNRISNNCSIPIISKMSDAKSKLPAQTFMMLQHNIKCDDLYRFIHNTKFNNKILTNEFNTQIIIL